MDVVNFLPVLLTLFANQHAECTDIADSQRLLNDKLANYTKQLRPLYNQSKALDVYLSFDLVSIRDFDEREGKFTVTGVLKCYWFDEMFTWNPDDYGGVYNVQIDVSTIWIPSMALVNPTEEMKRVSEDWHILHVENTGLIANLAGGIFSASCQIDVTYYPWDKQYCELWFMAWGYTHQQINLIQMSNHSTFYIYSEHGMWTMRDSQTGTFPEASLASFGFHVERKPLFVVINILSPIIFLSFMNVLLFMIPIESGERISFCITVLLAIAVFLTLVGDNLPKTSNPMSILSYYLLSVLILSVCITLLNILSLRLFHADDKDEVGAFWKGLTHFIRCRCCGRSRARNKRPIQFTNGVHNNASNSHVSEPGIQAISKSQRSITNHSIVHGRVEYIHSLNNDTKYKMTEETTTKKEDEITWKDVSYAFDMVSFVLCVAALIFLTIYFLLAAAGTIGTN